jgi:hypothetical protein
MLTCLGGDQQQDLRVHEAHPAEARVDHRRTEGLVATFPLFVHNGTRRGAAPDAPPGMLQNLVTMETFNVRGG